jgi:hypothetical protein
LPKITSATARQPVTFQLLLAEVRFRPIGSAAERPRKDQKRSLAVLSVKQKQNGQANRPTFGSHSVETGSVLSKAA